MGYRYADGLYQTQGAARDAAIDDFLTASGTQQVSDAIEPGDTPEDIAREMIAADWHVPGIPWAPQMSDEDMADVVDDLAHAIRDRLEEHGVTDQLNTRKGRDE